jgi:hypothetical protein
VRHEAGHDRSGIYSKGHYRKATGGETALHLMDGRGLDSIVQPLLNIIRCYISAQTPHKNRLEIIIKDGG